jgi:hypothetical protein
VKISGIVLWAVVGGLAGFASAYFLADYEMGSAVVSGVIAAVVLGVALTFRQRKRRAS